MSELRDEFTLDITQYLAQLKVAETALDKLYAPRTLPPLPVPRVPDAPSTPRPQRRAEDAGVDRLANRLRVVQQELNRLGDDATPKQLEILERRLGRLATQADLLAPGMDKGSAAAVKLGRVLDGLVVAAAGVQTAMERTGQDRSVAQQTAAIDAQVKSLGKSVGTLRGLWQTQIVTDEQAGQSALKLRDRLLTLAAADHASADAVLAATKAAAAAQRVLDGSNQQTTKGGFAYSASIGILDALARLGGPAGTAALFIGRLVSEGLVNGLNLGRPQVGKGAQDIGDTVIQSLKTKLEIRSPSRVTTLFGLNLAQGLALGMKAGTADVAKAGFNLGQAAQNGIAAGGANPFGPKVGQNVGVAAAALGAVAGGAGNGAAALGKFALSAEQVVFLAGAAATALIGLGAGFAVAVKQGAAFEEQIANIRALTQPTAVELQQLSEAAMNLGTNLGVGPTETAKAVLELSKAGLSAADSIGGGLAGALNLAGAAGITAGQGANIAVAAMTAFGLTAEGLPQVADVFANFANKTTLSAEDLSQAIAAVGPVALDAGLDLGQFAGYMATLAQGGFRQMSDAGTSLKTMLLSLEAPSDVAKARLTQLGESFYDAAGNSKPLNEVLDGLRGKIANLTDEDKRAVLRDIFGQDAIRAALVLLKQTPDALDANIRAMGLTGEAARVARERLESLAGQGKVLKAEFDTFVTTIGLALVPALTQVVKGTRLFFEGANAVLNSSKELGKYLPQLTTLIIGVGLAYAYVRREALLTAAVNVVGQIPALFGAARLAIIAAATAIKTTYIPAIVAAAQATLAFIAANPWLLVIAGTTAAAVAIQTHFQEINNTYAQMDASSQASFEKTMERVRALNREGGELNATRAKYLLAVQQLTSAEQGTLTGVSVFGERQYAVDPEQVEQARARVLALREELTRLNTEASRRGAAAPSPVKLADPADLKKQAEAIAELRRSINDQAFEVRLKGMTDVEQQLARLEQDFDQLSIKVKTAFNFDLTNPQLQAALTELRTARGVQTEAILSQGLEAQRKIRLDHEKGVLAAESALNRDALAQRRTELNRQIDDVKATYGPQITEALNNAKAAGPGIARQGFYENAAKLQALQTREVSALEQQRDRELDRIAQERLDKVRAAQRATLDEQARGIGAQITLLEGQRDRELQIAGEVPATRLAIEARYSSQLQRLRDAQTAVQGQSQRAALLATYQQQLRDAETAGTQRTALETEARRTYLQGLRTLELDQGAQTAAQLLAQEQRLQEQRLKVYQERLDKRLELVKTGTAAELDGLERVLRAERARAVAAGDGGRVAALDTALKTIDTQQVENLREFKTQLAEAGKEAGSLRTQLAGIAQTPLESAIKGAVSPFDAVITGAQKQLDELRKKASRADLSPGVLADYRRQEQQVTDLITTATAQRGAAKVAATVKFERAANDKAHEFAVAQSKRELDLGQITQGEYERRLQQDQVYWETRKANAQRAGLTADVESADQHLQQNASELTRLDTERRALARDTAAFTREQLQASVELATTEQGRAQAVQALARANRDHLAELDQEIATLIAQGGHEKELLDLRRQRAGVQKELTQNAQAEREHARALVASERDRTDAELGLAERLAQSDADLQAIRAAGIRNQLARLGDLDRAIGETRGEEERNRLTAQRLGLYGQIVDAQQAFNRLPLDAEQRRLDVLRAETAERLELQGLTGDGVATAEAALEQARSALDLSRENAALARPQAERDTARVELAQAETTVLQAQRAVSQARLAAEDALLATVRERVLAEAQIAGISTDSAAGRQLDLAFTRQTLTVTQERLRNAGAFLLTQEQVTALQTREQQLQAQLVQGERDLARERLAQQRAALDVAEASTRSALARSRFAGDAVATARIDLAVTRAQLEINRQSLDQARAQGLSAADRQGLQKERVTLLGQEAEGIRKVTEAERARVTLERTLRDALIALNRGARTQPTGEGGAVAQAQDDLTLSTTKLHEAEEAASGFLTRLQQSQVALDRLGQRSGLDRNIFEGLVQAGRSASDAADQVSRLDAEAERTANGQFLTFQEAQDGKERLDALASAITVYRGKLDSLASAYDATINGIDSVVEATSRLNAVQLTGIGPTPTQPGDVADQAKANAFALQVVERRRQDALAETTRLLADQGSSYAQLSAAAGRLAQAESGRATLLKTQVQTLGEQLATGDDRASAPLRDQLAQLGYTGGQIQELFRNLRAGQKDALDSVQIRITDQAAAQLDQLRQRAIADLQGVDDLRVRAFQARAQAAAQVEAYARLGVAVRLADAGFSELEASQLAALTNQTTLQRLLDQASATDPGRITRTDAARALQAENDALIRQVQVRRQLADPALVTRQDLTEQQAINRAIAQDQAVQAARLADPARRQAEVDAEVSRLQAILTATAPALADFEHQRADLIATSLERALANVTLPGLDDQADAVGAATGQRLARSIQAELNTLRLPDLAAQGAGIGTRLAREIQAALDAVLVGGATRIRLPAVGSPTPGTGGTIIHNTYDIRLAVDGQPYPTVPSTDELVRRAVPAIVDHLEDRQRRAGRNC
ncbi:phage tail tape measure protein [Deinococcus rufus]|uniref:Phage tail tape measure protein n=1 Tax=Deinococcus rufus TaxID=2136097 RepID=A0ABV7Z7W7_9DEIO